MDGTEIKKYARGGGDVLSGNATWSATPTGAITQLRTFAFTRVDGVGAESKFQVAADGVVYPSPTTYFTDSPVLFANVFAKTLEVHLFQARSSGDVNAIVEDFYLAGGGVVFPQNACPRCLGMGNLNDIVFDELGKLETVDKVDKLGQELEKGILILLKSNVFHEELGSLLKEGTIAPYAIDEAFRDQKLTQSILDVVRLIRDQQQLLKGSQDISPEETIKEVLNVRVSSEDDPRHLVIHIDLLTESGATYIYTREV